MDLNQGDYDKRTPLHLAVSSGHFDIIQYLIKKKVNPNPVDRWNATPLDDAKTDEIINFLTMYGGVKGGHSLDYQVLETVLVSEDSFRLYYAAFTNDVNLIKSLHIAHEMNHHDYDGRTALGIAASEGNLEAVQYLVSHGANINHKDARGNDALADAKREGRVSVVEYLEKILVNRSQ